ncbi:hypothetical protein MPTK1_2g08070 [Marchantia polymorpha subsp. ruderalis]|uniref:Uncharacterized protein n=1 Tax=Marchantia polymorpha TaxID=3197 RepID=A0A2R6XGP4_MARPO|nr:hypothetical protein MARPO_0015s0094 [Marchantia polymorpha]BBN01521.1 hypothetical protein Mp_2g08070 [Marchantia polymorpha subsp. ruderalis]|eukprot:PTQ45290.1 hypothetical protein MARPO_0015s0094 [Marchantia polymorpha]
MLFIYDVKPDVWRYGNFAADSSSHTFFRCIGHKGKILAAASREASVERLPYCEIEIYLDPEFYFTFRMKTALPMHSLVDVLGSLTYKSKVQEKELIQKSIGAWEPVTK